MIKIRFFRSVKGWLGFCVTGHAGFADHGDDVVCAAVSTLTQAAVLGVEDVIQYPSHMECESGRLVLTLKPDDSFEWSKVQVILETTYQALMNIQQQYPNWVTLMTDGPGGE